MGLVPVHFSPIIMRLMNCDLLIFAPHPDDAEIHCGATIAAHTQLGATVVLVDATRGELGSRGTPEQRADEAAAAAKILGISKREQLDLGDGQLQRDNLQTRDIIIDCIRRNKPKIVLSISPQAHHPDHRALGDLIIDSLKACELHKLPDQQEAAVHDLRMLCYEAELVATGNMLVLPCSADNWQRKRDAIACYGSQLHKEGSNEAETSISKKAFQEWIDARGRVWGQQVGAPYGEAFSAPLHPPAVNDLRNLWPKYDLD